jgi:pre-mRNA-processing factor 17
VWEFGIPVQVKYIADPSMHAISSVSLTPNGKWWCGQSMDNQGKFSAVFRCNTWTLVFMLFNFLYAVLTYSANDRVKPNRKKTFKGHSVAGYACQIAFSHDNHYVLSGDGEGKLYIWDWKTTKVKCLATVPRHESLMPMFYHCLNADSTVFAST